MTQQGLEQEPRATLSFCECAQEALSQMGEEQLQMIKFKILDSSKSTKHVISGQDLN